MKLFYEFFKKYSKKHMSKYKFLKSSLFSFKNKVILKYRGAAQKISANKRFNPVAFSQNLRVHLQNYPNCVFPFQLLICWRKHLWMPNIH